MTVSMIWAQSPDGIIGRDGGLPWPRMAKDMKWFKQATLGNVVVMGRKTFESIGSKPLAGRVNIVLTRDTEFSPLGALVAHSVDAALELANNYSSDTEIFIIGGSEIYRQFMRYASTLYITTIWVIAEGDATIPLVELDKWECVFLEPQLDESGTSLYFSVYKRKDTGFSSSAPTTTFSEW